MCDTDSFSFPLSFMTRITVRRMNRLRRQTSAVFRLAMVGLLFLVMSSTSTRAANLIDVWRADALTLNDGDFVGTWSSASNRTLNAAPGNQPTFVRNATPAGTAAVRFNRHFLTGVSPLGGRTGFSIAIVFKPGAPGAGDNAQWYGKSGIVDAEQPGATLDWGTVPRPKWPGRHRHRESRRQHLLDRRIAGGQQLSRGCVQLGRRLAIGLPR
jgi:hypothetical protein